MTLSDADPQEITRSNKEKTMSKCKAATDASPMTLSGRSIIVTGGGRGIGLAVAHLASDLGARVVLVDANDEDLRSAQSAIGADKAMIAHGNVSDAAFVQQTVEDAVKRFGKVDGLVNMAGITRPAMIEKMSLAKWQEVLDVHLTGAFLFLQAVGRHMISRFNDGDRIQGSIVNISSDAGRQGTIGQINYGTAKAGILGATMSAAREWAKYGIRVNTVSFGVVETPMTEVIRGEKFRDTYLAKIPLGRWSTPEEVAPVVCFFLSQASSFVTGQCLSANGGSEMNA